VASFLVAVEPFWIPFLVVWALGCRFLFLGCLFCVPFGVPGLPWSPAADLFDQSWLLDTVFFVVRRLLGSMDVRSDRISKLMLDVLPFPFWMRG